MRERVCANQRRGQLNLSILIFAERVFLGAQLQGPPAALNKSVFVLFGKM